MGQHTHQTSDRAIRFRIFFVLFLAIFSAMLGLAIILPIMPLYARSDHIGASGFWLGAIFAGFSISRSAFMPAIGKLSDRKGIRKGFIATGLAVYSLSTIGYIYAFNVFTLFLVRVLQGLCSAMIVPIAMAYIGDITPKDREGSYMGLFTVSLFLGFGFGPFLGGFIQEFFNVNTAFVAMGVLTGLAFLLVLIGLPSSRARHPAKRPEPSSFREIIRRPQMKGIICFRFVSSFGRAAVLTFLPLYASYDLGLTAFDIGLIISAGVLLTSFLQYPCGRLADTINRRNLILTGSLLYSLAIVTFPFTHNFVQVLGLSLLLGAFGAIPLPAATALIVEEGKKSGMGSTMAVFNVAMSLGLGVGPLVSGIIHDISGLKNVFYFSAALGVAGTLIVGHFLSSSPPPPTVPPEKRKVVEDI